MEKKSLVFLNEDERAAEKKISAAKVALSLSMPYIATPLLHFRTIPASNLLCRTMATDGSCIYYFPGFVNGITGKELQGVLVHELMHVLFQHAARKKNRERWCWNFACDYAVNAILLEMGITLPKGALYDCRYRDMTAEEIYEQIENQNRWELPRLSDKRDGREENNPRHIALPEDVENDLLEEDGPLLPKYGDEMTAEEVANQREKIRVLGEKLASELEDRGYMSGKVKALLQKAQGGRVNWQRLLQQWLTDRLKTDWSMFPPSKRHIWRGLYLPSVGAPAPGHLYMVVDTSGSVPDETLGRVFDEIDAFREIFPCRLTVIQADAEVTSVKEYEAYDCDADADGSLVYGRGGTDFRPAFEWIEEHSASEGETGAVIYLTDGYGTAPDRSLFPVLWLITQDGCQDGRFPKIGTVVRLSF